MMPFGLRNAPASFQRMMDTVLDDIQDFSGAYMDDIIIFRDLGRPCGTHEMCARQIEEGWTDGQASKMPVWKRSETM